MRLDNMHTHKENRKETDNETQGWEKTQENEEVEQPCLKFSKLNKYSCVNNVYTTFRIFPRSDTVGPL